MGILQHYKPLHEKKERKIRRHNFTPPIHRDIINIHS